MAAVQYGSNIIAMEIVYKYPAPTPVVLLYKDREDLFKKWIFKDIKYTVVDVGILCIHPALIFKTVFRFFRERAARKISPDNFIKSLIKKIYEIHLLVYVEAIRPSVVVTWIDDSGVFHRLSRQCKSAGFFAIQNGLRLPYQLENLVPKPPSPNSVISMPDFFCIGAADVELYKKHGHQIDRYHPIGSLVGGIYWSEISHEADCEYDICYISQWEEWFDQSRFDECCPIDNLRRLVLLGSQAIFDNLKRLILESDLSLLVALRYDGCAQEKDFFIKQLGASVKFCDSNRANFSTYQSIDKSRLTVNLISTCGLEALSAGHRVLFCNSTNDHSIGIFPAGICYFEGSDYDQFRARVELLMSMSDELFQKQMKSNIDFLSNFQIQDPPHNKIRGAILNLLGTA